MRRRFPVVLALVAIAAACSGDDGAERGEGGEITEAGPVSVFELRIGDCLSLEDGLSGDLKDLSAVPCSEPHTQEVFALPEMEAEGDVYPGEDEIKSFADAACLEAFPEYTGQDYLDAEGLYFSYLHPSLDSWNEGDDRQIVCVIGGTGGESLTGTVRDSGSGSDEAEDADEDETTTTSTTAPEDEG